MPSTFVKLPLIKFESLCVCIFIMRVGIDVFISVDFGCFLSKDYEFCFDLKGLAVNIKFGNQTMIPQPVNHFKTAVNQTIIDRITDILNVVLLWVG